MMNRVPEVFVSMLSLLIVITGCAASKTDIADVFHYNYSLTSPPTGTLSYEDEDLQFTFTPGSDSIEILFVNKSDHHAKINWAEATYIDKDGVSHHLITEKAKFEGKDKVQTPTVLAPGSRLVGRVIPADNIRHTLLGRRVRPMFPKLGDVDTIDMWDRTTFKLMLPMEVNGESRHYEFKFRVKIR